MLEIDSNNRPKIIIETPAYDLTSFRFEHIKQSIYSSNTIAYLAHYDDDGIMRFHVTLGKEATSNENELLIKVRVIDRRDVDNLPEAHHLDASRESEIKTDEILNKRSYNTIVQKYYKTTKERLDKFYEENDKEHKEYILDRMEHFGIQNPTLHDLDNKPQLTIVSDGATNYHKIGETYFHFSITCKAMEIENYSLCSDEKYSLYYFYEKDEHYRVEEAFILDKKEVDEDTVEISLNCADFVYSDMPDDYEDDYEDIDESEFDGEDYYGNYLDGDGLLDTDMCINRKTHSFVTSKKAFEEFEHNLYFHTALTLRLKTDVKYWA